MCNLLKRAAQVKEQFSEAVVRRFKIRCSQKFCRFYRKTSLSESLCDEAADLL